MLPGRRTAIFVATKQSSCVWTTYSLPFPLTRNLCNKVLRLHSDEDEVHGPAESGLIQEESGPHRTFCQLAGSQDVPSACKLIQHERGDRLAPRRGVRAAALEEVALTRPPLIFLVNQAAEVISQCIDLG